MSLSLNFLISKLGERPLPCLLQAQGGPQRAASKPGRMGLACRDDLGGPEPLRPRLPPWKSENDGPTSPQARCEAACSGPAILCFPLLLIRGTLKPRAFQRHWRRPHRMPRDPSLGILMCILERQVCASQKCSPWMFGVSSSLLARLRECGWCVCDVCGVCVWCLMSVDWRVCLSLGCGNGIQSLRGSGSRHLFLTVPEARGPRSRCPDAQVLMRAPFLAAF